MLAEIQTALDGRLATFGGEIAWEGVPYFPKVGTPYVASQVAGRGAIQAGVGPNSPRFWTGFYRLLVAYPTGEGLGPAYVMADALMALFPRGLTLTVGSSTMQVERSFTESAYSAADWINVPVTVQWFYQEP